MARTLDRCYDVVNVIRLNKYVRPKSPITATEAAEQLLPTTSIPWFDAGSMTGCLDTLDRIVANTPCFNLHFRPDRDVTDVISPLF